MSKHPQEVKVFDFESRMREIIVETFEPVARRAEEDRENILTLLKQSRKHGRQLERLQQASAHTDKRLLLLDDFSVRIFKFDAERKAEESELARKISDLHTNFESVALDLERAAKLLEQLETRNLFLDAELSKIHEVISQHKDSVAKTIRELMATVEFNCKDLVKAASKAEGAARDSNLKLSEVLKLGPHLTSQVESLKRSMQDAEGELVRLKQVKLEEKELMLHRKEWQLEVGRLKEGQHQAERGRVAIENYLEKYVPLSLQAALSESLHASLGNKSLRRLVQYETTKIQELKLAFTEKMGSLDALKSRGREEIKQAEYRATNPVFQEEEDQQIEGKVWSTRGLRRRDEQEAEEFGFTTEEEKEEPKVAFTFDQDSQTTPKSSTQSQASLLSPRADDSSQKSSSEPTSDKAEPELLQQIYAEPQFSEAEVSELKGLPHEFSTFKTELLSAFELKLAYMLDLQDKEFQELRAYVETIQTELESALRQHKRDRAEWNSKVNTFEAMLSAAGEEINKRTEDVQHISQLLACIVEFDLISNSLMLKDELDREAIQLTGYRDFNKPESSKQVVSMSPDCVSCSGHAAGLISAFKMACLSYSPSQMTYRHRKFSRQQLIVIQGSMLQEQWGQLKLTSPFLGTNFTPVLDEPIRVKTAVRKTVRLGSYTPMPMKAQETSTHTPRLHETYTPTPRPIMTTSSPNPRRTQKRLSSLNSTR
jgi:hypothetical protein